MARKGENIYKRKDGRWEGRFIKGRRPNGKAVYASVYGREYGEVRDRLILLKAEYATRKNITTATYTFKGALREWLACWLTDTVKPKVKPSTYAGYRHKLETYVLPELGDKRLDKITEEDVKGLMEYLKEKGYRPGTVKTIVRVLGAALRYAAKKGLLFIDPCKDLELPRTPKAEVKALTREEQRILEQTALESDDGATVVLSTYAGLRLGEVSGLRWTDVDFGKGELRVRRTLQRIMAYDGGNAKTKVVIGPPKSESSRRTIPLAPAVLHYLAREKEKSGSEYVVSCKGGYAEPRVITYRFAKLMKAAGLEHISFHSLRHTFATRCIETHADVAALSSLMGHHSVKMTLDTYVSSMPEQRRAAMVRLGALMHGGSRMDTRPMPTTS